MRIDRRNVLRGAAGLAVGLANWRLAAAPARAESGITPNQRDALLVIDVQNCFTPGGSLAVAKGDEVVAVINRIGPAFANVVETQDWHTPGHASFASAHPGKKPFETIKMPYGDQVLWPDHCVQGTAGAGLAPGLTLPQTELIIRKGYHPSVDSYSAFNEADGTPTGLAAYLKQRGISRVFLAGLATDYCVAFSAIDARKNRFSAYVIEDACRGIDLNGSMARAWTGMLAVGVHRIQSTDIILPS